MSYHQQGQGHICGLYYNVPFNGWRLDRNYLPQVELRAHATILSTTSRTVLTQTFANPSTKTGIKECRYTFPLYDAVSIIGFTCHVGDRTIIGEVKEKEKARAVYKEAVARGETAGLMEQLPDASDVFTTTVGNIPPGGKVVIKITYLGELKHDTEVDGIRFTIPNIICPRYGSYPGTLRTPPGTTGAVDCSISITVDAEMPDGSFIQKIQSPTHPIAMTMGTTSLAPDAEPAMSKASATLSLRTAQLETDFVLQVIAKNTGVPRAILEIHPTIPNHRALMATLVPKFSLPPEKPEVVFVCDRSGSMGGTRIKLATQALKVFLKSLPIGVKFNICSFGSGHSFLWPRSVTYNQTTLDEAMRHADTFSANFGGTEMLPPLRATIEQRYKDMPLEIMMLTDGETWNQDALFSYLNQSIREVKASIRVFTLGIGNGVSHALIEGVAKAGNGFSQTVGEGEKMDSKVVRMLKGALSPHINDYTLEINYGSGASTPATDDDDDFEIIEKVADSLKVRLDLSDQKEEQEKTKKPISLFDPSADPDAEDSPSNDMTGQAQYAHLPAIAVPKIMQVPQAIPPLFVFNRTTVYLLLSPSAPSAVPKSIVLRGTCTHGPLELEIPIQVLDKPGETIHQLAAKKAISELEQGRGWLAEARDGSDALIKSKYEGRFNDMIEREAVRLGVQFQVGGKWCSFVAVESNKSNNKDQERQGGGWEWLEDERDTAPSQDKVKKRTYPDSSSAPQQPHQQISRHQTPHSMVPGQVKPGFGLLGSTGSTAGFGNSGRPTVHQQQQMQQPQQHQQLDAAYWIPQAKPDGRAFHFNTLSSTATAPTPPPYQYQTHMSLPAYQMSLMNLEQQNKNRLYMAKDPSQEMANHTFAGSGKVPWNANMQSVFGMQDYSNQLMLLEQQGKKRSMMAKQEQGDAVSGKRSRGQVGGVGISTAAEAEDLLASQPSEEYSMHSGALENFDFDAFLHTGDNEAFSPICGANKEDEVVDCDKKDFSYSPVSPPGYSPISPAYAPTPPTYSPIATAMMARKADGSSRQRVPPLTDGGNDAINMGMRPPSAHPELLHLSFSPLSSSGPHKAGGLAERPLGGEKLLQHLITLQSFKGSWTYDASLLTALNIDSARFNAFLTTFPGNAHETVSTTVLIIAVFEERLREWEGAWELVVEKARRWLGSEMGGSDIEEALGRARGILGL